MSNDEYINCAECGKRHWDGDKPAVKANRGIISVVCRTHALWADRHQNKRIKDMLRKTQEPKA